MTGNVLAFVVLALLLWKLLGYLRFYLAVCLLHRLPGPKSESFLAGNMKQFLARDGADFQKHVALDYGPVVKLSGYLGRPLLYVSDPKALHNVLIKDEPIFREVETFSIITLKMFGPGLLSTHGQQHGRQRKLMNPVFSVNHMRRMLPTFYSVCDSLRVAVAARLQDGPREVDMLHWMGRTALEIVGQAGLGHSFDPLVEDCEDPYSQAVKAIAPNLNPLLHYRWIVVLAHKMRLPAWFQRAVLNLFPANSAVARFVTVIDMLDTCSRKLYYTKKSAFEQGDEKTVEQIGRGKDIISILMRANAQTVESERLREEEVIAQLTTLVFAAMDTTSNTLSRTLHLLAEHPDVQSKLRQELLDARAAEGVLSYDELNKLPLLDCVCRETLRVYPVAVSARFRVAVEDTVLPLSEPIALTNGETVSELPIPAGTDLIIGILGSNLNKKYWGNDSEEWKPERWLSPPSPALTNAHIPGVYSNLLTFIGGKRACIGFKFAEMEMKVVLATLVSNFTFELSDKPIVWNNSSITFPSVDGGNRPSLPMKVGIYRAEEGLV